MGALAAVRRWAALAMVAAMAGGAAGTAADRLWAPAAPAPVAGWPVVTVVRNAQPAVVTVLNEQTGPQGFRVRGMGSGVVLRPDGIIVTNYHVVAGAARVAVVVQQGTRYLARVVGVDPPTDLAVLKISPNAPLTAMPVASGQPQAGELVVAIGNALGLSHSVTVGVVSGLDRLVYRDGWEFRLIQTDAAINPGNSGGALVDVHGRLVGINSSKIARVGIEGIGFAIPARTVATVVQQILRYGQVRRPWLGAVVQSAAGGPGLLVVAVVPGGPADRAGIRAGDWLLSAGGRQLRHLRDLTRILEQSAAGRRLPVTLLRGGQRLTVWPKLRLAPAESPRLSLQPANP
jgi:serine protease Do